MTKQKQKQGNVASWKCAACDGFNFASSTRCGRCRRTIEESRQFAGTEVAPASRDKQER